MKEYRAKTIDRLEVDHGDSCDEVLISCSYLEVNERSKGSLNYDGIVRAQMYQVKERLSGISLSLCASIIIRKSSQ